MSVVPLGTIAGSPAVRAQDGSQNQSAMSGLRLRAPGACVAAAFVTRSIQ